MKEYYLSNSLPLTPLPFFNLHASTKRKNSAPRRLIPKCSSQAWELTGSLKEWVCEMDPLFILGFGEKNEGSSLQLCLRAAYNYRAGVKIWIWNGHHRAVCINIWIHLVMLFLKVVEHLRSKTLLEEGSREGPWDLSGQVLPPVHILFPNYRQKNMTSVPILLYPYAFPAMIHLNLCEPELNKPSFS